MNMPRIHINQESGLIVPTLDISIKPVGEDFASINIHDPEVVTARFKTICFDGFNRCEKIMLAPIADIQSGVISLARELPSLASVEVLADCCKLMGPEYPAALETEVQTLVEKLAAHEALLEHFDITELSVAELRAYKAELPELALSFRSLTLQFPASPELSLDLNGDLIATAVHTSRTAATRMSFSLRAIQSGVIPAELPRLVHEVQESVANTLSGLGLVCHPMVQATIPHAVPLYKHCHAMQNVCDQWRADNLADVLHVRSAAQKLFAAAQRFAVEN